MLYIAEPLWFSDLQVHRSTDSSVLWFFGSGAHRLVESRVLGSVAKAFFTPAHAHGSREPRIDAVAHDCSCVTARHYRGSVGNPRVVKYKHMWGGTLTAYSPVARRDPILEDHMKFLGAILFLVILIAALKQRPKSCPTCGRQCVQSRFGNWFCPRCQAFHR